MKNIFTLDTQELAAVLPRLDGLVLVIPAAAAADDAKTSWQKALTGLPDSLRQTAINFGVRAKFAAKPKQAMSFDADSGKLRVTVVALARDASMFDLLTAARKSLEPLTSSHAVKIGLETRGLPERAADLADAFVAALGAAQWAFKKATKKSAAPDDDDDAPRAALTILCPSSQHNVITPRAELAAALADGTNLVRTLTRRTANDLDCRAYVQLLDETARTEGLSFRLHSQQELESMGAGAFLAVARGSSHRDAGIVRLSTQTGAIPDPTKKHLVLVGKGIVYDTGGVNIKPAEYMFGMEGDMMGSAVALALVIAAKRAQWPFTVTAYLAIADNATGENAYRPNEIVTSLKGTTIETVHTDAEGRMVLADTLHLAAQEKPDLMVDFATLTGACIRAIGTTYAGVFTNRPALHAALEKAGRETGERVWPFPLDEDFAECLESEVAEFKQCRVKGGVDHIEAAMFLKHFAGDDVPWVHVDLAPASHTGGLAHVGGDISGFGVRFAARFVLDHFAKP